MGYLRCCGEVEWMPYETNHWSTDCGITSAQNEVAQNRCCIDFTAIETVERRHGQFRALTPVHFLFGEEPVASPSFEYANESGTDEREIMGRTGQKAQTILGTKAQRSPRE